MKFIFRLVVNAAALLAFSALLPGVELANVWVAILSALVLGLVNALVRPLIVILTMPISIVTLGLFLFVVNALMVWLVSSLIPGFDIADFYSALLLAILLSVISWFTHWILKNER